MYDQTVSSGKKGRRTSHYGHEIAARNIFADCQGQLYRPLLLCPFPIWLMMQFTAL